MLKYTMATKINQNKTKTKKVVCIAQATFLFFGN
jgi:hypothetical protein